MRAPSRPVQLGLLALLFVGAGVEHFIRPAPYIGIVPPIFPVRPMLVTISGIAEIAGGLGILVGATRKAAGIGLIALLVVIFPANIYMLTSAIAAHERTWWLALLWIRLPLQPLLIWWAFRATIARRRSTS